MHPSSRTRVCCLGPEATFSHAAALMHFGPKAQVVTARSIPLVFQTVDSGNTAHGIVPVENSIEGSVGVTLDSFAGSECHICAEIFLRIEHLLLGSASELSAIQAVYSHPQALGQCRDWLARHLPHADVLPTASTAAAAEHAKADPACAAIGGIMLAEHHGLRILAENIQDRPVNLTRFWVIRKGSVPPPSGNDRTSLRIALAHRPGSLYNCLREFADQGINLTHIESRPCPDTPFRYTFFLDVEGHPEAQPLSTVLHRAQSAGNDIVLLGAYPRAEPLAQSTPRDVSAESGSSGTP